MRRIFSIIWIWIVFLGGLYCQDRPNILWVTIEDTSPQFIGAYGNADARTPVIDQLAQQGIRFTNAFSTGTVCSPSRSTIITGIPTYKMGTGNHRSNFPIPSEIHGFPHYLKKQGYYVSNNVKTDYNVANEKQFIEDTWDESSKTAGWWNRKKDQPFFAVFNFAESHQSRTMSMSYEWYLKNVREHLSEDEVIPDNAFVMPPIYRDSPEMRKQMARVYNSIALTDNRIGELLQKLQQDNLWDDTIIFFFADHGEGMPRGKTNGIDYGYRVPFVIWFPEKYKHLSPWGDSGTVTDELVDFEDLAPTLVSFLGGDVPEYMKGRILMGQDRSEPVDHLILSSDRADNGPDMVRSITDGRYLYSRNFMPFTPQVRHIRYINIGEITQHMREDLARNHLDSLQKSVFLERPSEYLFDLQNDPWETNNLADSPAHQSIMAQMRKYLEIGLKEAKDIHFLPEYELGEIAKNDTPYEFRQSKTDYPFEAIYAAASLSGKRDTSSLLKQMELLKNKNPIVRYWAVTGLKSHSLESITPFKKQLMDAMEDCYPPVTAISSALAFDNFQSKIAEDKLKQLAQNDNMHIALLTINEILYFKYKSPFLETIKTVYQLPKRNYNVKAACMDYLGLMGVVENIPKNEQ